MYAVHYPGLYAGSTDLVGVHKGADAIIDFKQTNKPKKREWISDYFSQLSAYAMAHNFIYKTKITKGVIMMCSKDHYYQEFVVEGKEFQKYKHNFLRRVDEYYQAQDQRRLDNIAKMYHKTSGDVQEMWRKKWYELVKTVANKITKEDNVKSKRLTTDSRKIY